MAQNQVNLVSTSKSFFDLPLELRRQIYPCFAHVPPAGTQNQQYRGEIILSRRFLQLVCRKINQEWAEFFYSTTTINANGPSPKTDGSSDEPVSFENQFLKKVDSWKLQHVRSIHSRVPVQVSRLDSRRWELDTDTAIDLAVSLSRHRAALMGLEEVIFHATTTKGDWHKIYDPVTVHSWEQVWERICGEDWSELQECIRVVLQNGLMKDWQVFQRIKVKWAWGQVHCVHSGPPYNYYEVKKIELVCRKVAKEILPATQGWIEFA
ncbi:hypothetical protein H2200_000138 [Cladophialophora chaetospira]|uniref:Uncharacterized protein n=1 Tax=Cladophialophora chaetospira TaxID=386627 RepID=A0AA39CQ19_9EURO|nr:hypothetical protein H2200_000138 [Cladophialophora chaetospira]